jgi:hypothetical protein
LVTPKAAPTEFARFSNLSHERLQIAQDFVSAQITLGGVELLHRIRQGQFALRKARSRKEDGAGDLECGARRLRRKAFKIDLGLQISTLHQSPSFPSGAP